MDLDPLELAVAFVVVAAAAAALRARYLTPTGRIRRAMRAVPRRSISSVADGERARLVGRVVPLERALVAPLSARPAVAFDLLVTVRGGRAAVALDRGVVLHESEDTDFGLDDGTGLAVVGTEGAELLLTPAVEEVSGGLSGMPRAVAELLAARGHGARGPLGLDLRLRCTEAVLVPGAPVAVVGTWRWQDRPGGGRGHERVLALSGEGPVLVSDQPVTMR